MSRLEISLLGPPLVTLDGAPLQVDTRKATAMLAYLAMTGEIVRRDQLANLLWPEFEQRKARAALRRTLSAARKGLKGTDWLVTERETVALNPDAGFRLDVIEFDRLINQGEVHGHDPADVCPDCVEPLKKAAALYRGDFLAGFTLRDSPNFDEWQFFHTESLRRLYAQALERLARGLSAADTLDEAIEFARRWSALDPLLEAAHRLLMLLYAWNDQRHAALRQYRECVRILEEELGVAPLDETTGLYLKIKDGGEAPLRPGFRSRAAVAPAPISEPRTALAPAAPLIGRELAWEVLSRAYERVGPDGRFVGLQGEAGIGKTHLAHAFLNQVRSAGGRVLTLRCYEGEASLVYGPLVEGMNTLLQTYGADWLPAVSDASLQEAARLLPELGEQRSELLSPGALDKPGAQTRFYEGVSQWLETALRGSSPGVIFIDDAHWADSATVELFSYLVRRLDGREIMVLAAWRPDLLSADHRLLTLTSETQRAGSGHLLELGRLDQAGVAELIRASGYDSAPRDFEARLYAETEGLPFFIVEYLALLDPVRVAGSADPWPLPGGVRDLLQSRLKQVDETGWQLLTSAAVIGRSFDFDTLRTTSGRSEEEAVRGLEGLVSQGFITEMTRTSGRDELVYDFNHERIRSYVYDEISLARRRLLHRRIAEALSERARTPHQEAVLASKMAYHYRMAGQDNLAAALYKAAGSHAQSLFANEEAIEYYRAALALGQPDAAGLHEAVGDLQTLLGAYPAALSSYETAAAFSETESPALLEHKMGMVYGRMGAWALAESHFQAALRAEDDQTTPEARARILADWSLTAHHRGEPKQAVRLAEEALASADGTGDHLALAQVHNLLGILARSRDDSQTASHHLELSLEQAEQAADPGAKVAALNNMALVHADLEEYAHAQSSLASALKLCRLQGDRHREAALLNNLADLQHRSGDADGSMEYLKEAVAIFAEIGVEIGDHQPEIWKLVEW